MAVRSQRSICLFCQTRQTPLFQQKRAKTTKRGLGTVALQPEDDGFLHHSNTSAELEASKDRTVLPLEDTMRQVRLDSSVDILRDALLGFNALRSRRDMRLDVLRNLSNPVPPVANTRRSGVKETRPTISPDDTPIPHLTFRQNVKEALGQKAIRQVMREQLLRCQFPKEILRVVAVAMQKKETAWHISHLHENIMRALYRCRPNIPDPEVLATLNTIIARFRSSGLPVDPQLLHMGLKFAARARSLHGMKRYLQDLRDRDLPMSSNVFRSVIAKFSIGHRGLGEIRNGRWKRAQLMQVLTGFDDAVNLPAEKQYHLGSFLDRSDWQYLHGWVAVLARCKAVDDVWREWELWKTAEARVRPKNLASMGKNVTSKVRGDYWFIEQMTYAGGLDHAWQIIKETGIDLPLLKPRVKEKLLEAMEFATVWNEEIRQEMVKKYDADLSRIESALGVKWEAGAEDGEGCHILVGDQEEYLEKLGSEEFRAKPDYGFPYEDSPIVSQQERPLHEAEETVPADTAHAGGTSI